MSAVPNCHKRHGVPVVRLSEKAGQRYELDEEALASVLLRPDVRALPVVVVSVAGVYRSGKSFILDFFLRYLTASRSSQLSTEWLGREDDVLEGFDWRGGGEANTKGIHLWPEPIIVTIERTGEKVAVLLMDTQGTFDAECDMADNSTIFALSTLLSSVQIYNLRANIGEDDLQHLQLFTEYGRLACDDVSGKAFQTLTFLIRDWMSPFELPHGYSGGEALLRKRLQAKPNQKPQLREVREHIHSCFERLQCFLMPHPGLTVADQSFKGRLCDISESFRLSLLELIPSLFDPNNLSPKMINGEKVQAQYLLEYFKQYVNVFNSDDLPEATTIFQATADACMLAALREARERYEATMESYIVEDQSVSLSMMQGWHSTAVNVAIDHFRAKKKLGTPDNVESHLETLSKELEARLSLYLWQNDAKVRDTVALAKKSYDKCMASVCDVQARLCLHAKDLAALHQRAMCAALDIFDITRKQLPRDQDEERKNLIQHMEQVYQHLCSLNAQNNRNAILEARDMYLSRMRDSINQAAVSSEVLLDHHEKALAAAIKHFHSYRNRCTAEADDPDVEQLEQSIAECFQEIEKNNVHSNMWAMQVAEYTYNNYVSSAWGPQSCCFHPDALKNLHKAAKNHALEQFLTDRVKSDQDDFKEKLISNLETRYQELRAINSYNNKQAVEQAFGEYTRLMDKHSRPSLSSILIAPFIIKMIMLISKHHQSARTEALRVFHQRRRGDTYDEDSYLADLNEKINQAFEEYKHPLNAIIQELGLQNLLPPPM